MRRFRMWRLRVWELRVEEAQELLREAIAIGSLNLEYQAEQSVTHALARRAVWRQRVKRS